jgi:hypothetical protein
MLLGRASHHDQLRLLQCHVLWWLVDLLSLKSKNLRYIFTYVFLVLPDYLQLMAVFGLILLHDVVVSVVLIIPGQLLQGLLMGDIVGL